MQIPEGFVALDLVGFTDKGNYSPSEIYMTNDLVHRKNIVWKCLQDNIVNIVPSKESSAWEIFIEGELPFFGSYETFPRPGESERFYVDNTVDPRLMYTWDPNKNDYVLTGGAGGADGGSVDIPITLTAEEWEGTSAPYAQTITVPQMREGMTPLYFLSSEGDAAQYAFSLITGYQAGYAEITFYAADTPTVDIDLVLKGIPAQEMEYVDNTVVFLVEPSNFALNDTTQRYEATITIDGMTAGTGGTWDIVRSGPVLTEEESKIALSITDVDRLDGAVKISCLEVPAQRYMMSLAGTYIGAEEGTVILANMQEWFDKTENQQEEINLLKTNKATIAKRGWGSTIDLQMPHGLLLVSEHTLYALWAAGNPGDYQLNTSLIFGPDSLDFMIDATTGKVTASKKSGTNSGIVYIGA